ncbi:MAG: acyltransferase family protein, partial [Candidatus Methanoperedens sp.]
MNTSKMHHSYIPQIDLLKGVAIISVIIQHSVTKNQLSQTLSQFHIWQAIPIFFIVMGFTSMIYFSQKKINIMSFDWSNYLAGRYTRILIPYLIIFFISLLYGIYHNKYYFGLG